MNLNFFYLLEGFRSGVDIEGKATSTPTHTQAVTVQQLAGATVRLLDGEADMVQVTKISEEIFIQFYQERRRTKV